MNETIIKELVELSDYLAGRIRGESDDIDTQKSRLAILEAEKNYDQSVTGSTADLLTNAQHRRDKYVNWKSAVEAAIAHGRVAG